MGTSTNALQQLAGQAVAERWRVLRAQLDQLTADPRSVEAVHQVRVAGRRLRVALRGFADVLPGKKAKRWAKDVARLMRALGRVRDADVQLQFVDDYLAAHGSPVGAGRARKPRWVTGVTRLRLRLSQQRDRQAGRIDRALARFNEVMAKRSLPAVDGEGVEPPVDLKDPALREHADRAIAAGVEALLAFGPYVDQPDCIEPLHRMRIAAKRLRYTLELYEPVLRKRQRRMLSRVRKLQTLLGELHDCDVWIAQLPGFIESERQRMAEYQGHLRGFARIKQGIEHLLHDRRAARAVSRQALSGYWQRLNDSKTFALPKAVKPAKPEKSQQAEEATPVAEPSPAQPPDEPLNGASAASGNA